MTFDLIGLSALVVAVATPMGVIFGQINTRNAVKAADARAAAAEAIAAAERKKQSATLATVSDTLDTASKNIDGNLSATKLVAKHLGVKADTLGAEVERLSREGAAPTPVGTPGGESAVTIDADTGRALVAAAPHISESLPHAVDERGEE
jgi:hypothetical protein